MTAVKRLRRDQLGLLVQVAAGARPLVIQYSDTFRLLNAKGFARADYGVGPDEDRLVIYPTEAGVAWLVEHGHEIPSGPAPATNASENERSAIRAHWKHYELRFTGDGRVLARRFRGSPWGVLYSAEDLARHLAELRSG